MGRTPCCEKVGLKKGPWTPEEDQKLLAHIEEHGQGSWRALPSKAGLQRCGKSCRLRWTNYLRPDIKRGKFSLQEEQTIIQLHALLGNRWSTIATRLPNRTDNEIKNYWNTHLKKRLGKMGIDAITHKPKSDAQSKTAANLRHMAQWESARLEAEARLVRESFQHRLSRPTSVFALNDGLISDLESPQSTLTFSENGIGLSSITMSTELGIIKQERKGGIESSTNLDMEDGFINLLLNDPTYPSSSDSGKESDEIHHEYENNKNYWNGILDLVNSSPSDSPMF